LIKNLTLLFVAVILISGCATTSEQADPVVGQWEFEFSNLPQGDPNGILTFNKEGGIYSGTIANSDGESELIDLSVDAGNTLTAHFEFQGRSLELSAVIDGDSITGQTKMRRRTYEFSGKRIE
jgi:hypothetical protein